VRLKRRNIHEEAVQLEAVRSTEETLLISYPRALRWKQSMGCPATAAANLYRCSTALIFSLPLFSLLLYTPPAFLSAFPSQNATYLISMKEDDSYGFPFIIRRDSESTITSRKKKEQRITPCLTEQILSHMSELRPRD